MKKILYQGAEAIIYKKNNLVIKDRISKSYRLKKIDETIRKRRTKREKKLLEKSSKIINSPVPMPTKEKTKIILPYIKGKKLSEHLDKLPEKQAKIICEKIGQSIAKLHDNHIIHGDLTTSNMILEGEQFREQTKAETRFHNSDTPSGRAGEEWRRDIKSRRGVEDNKTPDKKLYFIDFGLGFQSEKTEDKAVDLHLIKQALEAKHFTKFKDYWKWILQGYKISKDYEKNLERLKKVEVRGKYKKH